MKRNCNKQIELLDKTLENILSETSDLKSSETARARKEYIAYITITYALLTGNDIEIIQRAITKEMLYYVTGFGKNRAKVVIWLY